MNFSGWSLLAGVMFGAIGVGYFMYGRREARIAYFVCGLVLAIFPWFVTNLAALIGIGIALVAAPFVAVWWLGL
jgi:hypothetical protein